MHGVGLCVSAFNDLLNVEVQNALFDKNLKMHFTKSRQIHKALNAFAV